MLGVVAGAKLLIAPEAYYCPAYDQGLETKYAYNTPENRWPDFKNYPDDPLFKAPLPAASAPPEHTYISYNLRPVACWPSASKPTADQADSRFWTPYLSSDWNEASPTNANHNRGKFGFPRFSKLKNAAIASDLIISKHYVERTHKRGINVLYANGSVKFVRMDEFMGKQAQADPITKKWLNIPAANSVTTDHNDIFLRLATADTVTRNDRGVITGTTPGMPAGGVWGELDKAGGQ
jgi:hypothetical protein